MLRIFRSIRQRLLAENRFTRYLIYALGEIILVVAGILIALQINNWNEHRKLEQTWKTNVQSLIKELEQDTSVFHYVVDFIEQDNEAIDHVIDRLSSEHATIDTLKYIARHELPYDFKTYRPPNNKTLNAMKSNGTVELFDEVTYDMILNLQKLQSVSANIIKTNNSAYVDQLLEYTSKYPLKDISAIRGPLHKKQWKKVDTDDLYTKVQSLLTLKKLSYRNNLTQYRELLTQTTQVLERLH